MDISNIDLLFTSSGNGKELNVETEIYLFRIIQEALTNIIKHSEAKKAWLTINFEKERIFVVIKDRG